jgi:hypothetical protein
MKSRVLVWVTVCVVFVLAMSARALPGWVLGVVVVAALVIAIPLSMKQHRAERRLARAIWRTIVRHGV